MAKMHGDRLQFSVDAALLFELGEQLVGRRSIALAEMIKNAYDADADTVVVTFERVTEPGGTIIVRDDGHGMTLEAIKKHWMRIATTNKVASPVSPKYKRHRTGAKGVGRFAARKLASKLTIHSVAQVTKSIWEEVTVQLDWDTFTPGMDLSALGSQYQVLRHAEPRKTGVELILTSVRDVWTNEDLDEIRRDLQDLTPPFPTALPDAASSRPDVAEEERDPGFSVRIVAPEFPELEGELTERFFSAAVAKLTARVRSDGRPEYTLRFRGSDKEFQFRPPEMQFGDLAGASFVLHYFLYAAPALEGTRIGLREAQGIGRRFGGVKIYLDRFRVFPYGDPGDDWLGLDADRAGRLHSVDSVLKELLPPGSRPMLNIPGNNQLFGGVFVSRTKHPGLKPNISRERLLENEAFDQLRQFVRFGVNWMTIQRARFEEDQRQEEARATRDVRDDMESRESSRPISGTDSSFAGPGTDTAQGTGDNLVAVEPPTAVDRSAAEAIRQTVTSIKDQLESLAGPEKSREIVDQLQDLTRQVEVREAEQISKMAMLRILASAGTSVVIFNHQIRAVIDGLRRLTRDLGEVGTPANLLFALDIDQTRERANSWLRIIEAQATQLGLLLGAEARRRRRKLAVRPVVDQLAATLALYCQIHGIEFVNAVPPQVRTPPLYEAELHSLLLNLLTNALKAVKEQPTRKVEVNAEVQPQGFRLLVKDTGHGLAASDRERVFEPFETTSTPDPVLGVGTGLGLTIVRDIITEHGGKARFIDIGSPWRTCVEITIPHGVDE